MILHVKKNPNANELCWVRYECNESDPVPDGWEKLTREQLAEWRSTQQEPSEPSPDPVPRAISNADLRRGLVERGINPQLVTDYISAMEDGPVKWATWADWEYANYMERAHPMLNQLAPAFGLTSADVDALFKSKPEWSML